MNESSFPIRTRRILLVVAAVATGIAFLVAALVCATAVTAATVEAAEEPLATDAAALVEPIVSALNLPFVDDEVRATSLFHVARSAPQLLGESRGPDNDEIFRRTQLAYLKSYFVIQSALRAPGVAQLSLLKSQPDPVGWLIDHLECEFEGNSEILRISLRGPSSHADELRQIVEAVSDAYLSEVVFEDEQRRLVVRDALRDSFARLNEEIRDKFDVQSALARDLSVAVPGGRDSAKRQITIRRLERIDAELMRLEGEQLAAKLRAEEQESENKPVDRVQLKFFDQRIAQLHQAQSDLEDRIAKWDHFSVELAVGGEELASLQKIAREMSWQVEKMDIESVAPDRIRRIQKAVVAPASRNQ
jgi:hypothetical protein